jgi:hypothetical protein
MRQSRFFSQQAGATKMFKLMGGGFFESQDVFKVGGAEIDFPMLPIGEGDGVGIKMKVDEKVSPLACLAPDMEFERRRRLLENRNDLLDRPGVAGSHNIDFGRSSH